VGLWELGGIISHLGTKFISRAPHWCHTQSCFGTHKQTHNMALVFRVRSQHCSYVGILYGPNSVKSDSAVQISYSTFEIVFPKLVGCLALRMAGGRHAQMRIWWSLFQFDVMQVAPAAWPGPVYAGGIGAPNRGVCRFVFVCMPILCTRLSTARGEFWCAGVLLVTSFHMTLLAWNCSGSDPA